jgi:regulator of protease activity HflC (stomatin/prohibitin superfamily)
MFETDFFYWMMAIFSIIAVCILIFYTVGFESFLPVVIVPSQEEWVVDRLGKDRVLKEGVRRILPGIDKIEAKVNLREMPIDPPAQEIITKDNINIKVDAIAMIKIIDSMKAVQEVENYEKAIEALIMTSVLSIMGNMNFVEIQRETDSISKKLIAHIEEDSLRWGIKMIQVKIENITPPKNIIEAMEKEIVAEKTQRAMLLEAEAKKKVVLLEAEAKKMAATLHTETVLHEIQMIQSIMKDVSNERILEFLTSTDYISSMKNLSTSENAKFVVYPSDIQKSMGGLMNSAALQPMIDRN